VWGRGGRGGTCMLETAGLSKDGSGGICRVKWTSGWMRE